ncbi:trichohyalin-like [Seriola lalandi dorsalis]|uniref:trichohyalin-like n=1 Tax=Seriola lalandi dorsalis TaxID=1841481 RepID=UPI000C6F82E1|nr:trichohyalin-like [Seriola lalandi dorsalis]
MTGVHKPLQCTQTDAIVEALSAESCHIVLETSPPDYVEKISRYLESSVGHGGQDAGPNDPAEEESDSGDSLFITQKPVPEAVRSRRRCRYNLKSDSSPARDLEESGDDLSSSDSHEESRAAKRRQAKRIRPPKFSFPFLTDRKSKHRSTQLCARQSTALHNYAMGGFLRCVRELWQSYQQEDDVQSSLPTVDMDGENIPPLSEEEERSESEDIKVVERKCFVAPSKSKCSQPWYTPGKRDFEVKRQRSSQRVRQEGTSQDRQRKKLHKILAKRSTSRVTAPSSDTESSDNGDPSHRVLTERETSDKHVTCDRSIAAKTRLTGGNKEILPQEKESEEELCGDSDATMCEALERGSPRENTLNGREPCPNVTEPPADVFYTDGLSETGQEEDEPESQSLLQSLPDLISDTNNDKTRVKNKKKAKGDDDSVEGGRGQSHKEPEGLHAAASVTVEEEETPSPSEDHPAEPPASQSSDQTQLSEDNPSHDDIIPRQEERLSPDSKQMKKKKRKKKKAADNIRVEEDGNLKSDVRSENDSLFSVTCNMVNDGKEEKKKKKKKKKERSVEQLIPLNEDETGRKKKKMKKEKLIVNMEEYEEEEALASDRPLSSERPLEEKENSDAPRETLEKKRKKQKKKQLSASHEEAEVGVDSGADMSSNNDVTLEGSTRQSVKKKKRRESIFEGEDISSTPDKNKKVNDAENPQKTDEVPDDQDAELVSKKKKKKRKRESICQGEDISSTPDKNKKLNNAGNCQKTDEGPDDQDTELVSKKKKKKKNNEMINRNVSEDAVTQSDDSVSVRKKEKKRTSSFLAADAEEKEAQTHDDKTSVAAHVWGAERPGVSAGEFQTESAEIAGNLETSNDGVRKKKRKRKMSMVQENVEEGHRQDVKEPNRHGGKKKKETKEK